MTEQIKRVNNPLTIIAIFAALAEVSSTVAIGLIDKQLHNVFIWFIIGFPTLLVIAFFLTLNFNTKVMYSPTDYREDKTFLDSLYGKVNSDKVEIDLVNKKLDQKLTDLEDRLIKSLDEKFDAKSVGANSKQEIKELLDNYKDEIKRLSEGAIPSSRQMDFVLPSLLKTAIIRWISFPAFIPIVYAIVKENCKSLHDLESNRQKYNLPLNWDKGGIRNLFKMKVLTGTNKNFTINTSIETELKKWIYLNEPTIVSIVAVFKNDTEEEMNNNGVSARMIAQELII